ncbi:MAG: hypothetical protein J07AB43_01330 [Candidatus Nanosalina sp. J07AB43]|jgi:hypothetical protein|nr:MAG: hypothetical protein J07AB43_01330 [Candidatus Nanosalina sp. J07AB43]
MPEDDYGMGGQNLDLPDYPGPAALGHEPLIGTARRNRDMPVLREELADAVDSTGPVDLPDDPVLPALNTVD